LAAMLANRDTPFLQIRAAGGAVNDIPADATAYAHRHQNFSISASALPGREVALARHWDRLAPYIDGLYLSFETGAGPDILALAFPEPTLSRLRDLKATYDPDNVFNQNHPLVPEPVIAL
jgi:hypothetical protein